MFEISAELIVFLLKSMITVVSILIVLSVAVSLSIKSKDTKGGFILKDLSRQMEKDTLKLKTQMLSKREAKKEVKKDSKALKKKESELSKEPKKDNKVMVLDFNGDIKASEAEVLKLCVTQCLKTLDPKNDQVVVRLESPGGMVSGYGLAASELSRFREQGLKVSVCVDKVAASGGYLMSCVADQIVASPFAVLGSIGVVASMPNFNKLLKKNSIDYEVLTAGKHKRTLTMFGENTEEGRKKFLDQLEQIHTLFKNFVSKYRPQLDIEEVATGEYWFGEDALNLKLTDKIQTSEDFLIELSKKNRLFHLSYKEKKSWTDKLTEAAQIKIFKDKNPIDFI